MRRRAAIVDESVDLAQYIRSLYLPMSLIRPSPQAAQILGHVGRLRPKIFCSFRLKTPEPPRPSPIVGFGDQKAHPSPN